MLIHKLLYFSGVPLIENIIPSKKYVSISVCVPCYPRDTHKLNRCLGSIKIQTILPNEVIISHSELSKKNAKNIKH